MTEVKGTAVKAILDFIKAKFKEEGRQKWLNSLPEESRKIFSGLIMASSWFPLEEAYNTPLRKMCELFYGGDEKKGGEEAGRYSAESALTGIYRFLLKLGNPGYMIKKASTIMPTYYKPSAMEVLENNPKDALLRLTELEGISVMAEHRIKGWILAALELTGTMNPKVEITSSIANGDPHTDFKMTWE